MRWLIGRAERSAWTPPRLRLTDPARIEPHRPSPAPAWRAQPRGDLSVAAAPLLVLVAVIAVETVANVDPARQEAFASTANILGLGALGVGVVARRRGIPRHRTTRRVTRLAALPLLLTVGVAAPSITSPICFIVGVVALLIEGVIVWRARTNRDARATAGAGGS